MSKQEFIDRLRAALSGNVEPGIVADNVAFYEEYISSEIRKGIGEEEVLRKLGDPRLIAKTIIETNSGSDGYRNGENAGYRDAENPDTGYERYRYGQNHQNNIKAYRMPGWLMTILVILILILIFSVVLSVLSFLAPVILAVLVVMFLVKLFRDWLN